jgi:GT2 family glycosyltransferase
VLANGLDPSLALTIPADRPRLDQPSDLMLRHRAFTVSRERLASLGPGAVSVTVAGGMPLYGSPLDPLAEIEEAIARARAVARLWPAPQAPIPALRERGVDVIIPVHRGRETTLACLASVMAHAAAGQRILVLADGVPDRPLLAALAEHHRRGAIVLHESADNSGFPATVNRGLRLSAGHDVVLLNSDTVVTPGWLDRLRQAVHAAPDIGTATPLSNDATIFSYPRPNAVNPMPDADEIQAIASVAAQVNAGVTVDVPTGHGFCLFIRAECLAETGLLREDVFAQGYGEENDFCLRARDLGWRSVAVPGVYVAHVGSQSFNAARSDLIARNLAALNRLHVGYDRRVADWIAADPLHVLRRRIDRARFAAARQGRKTVLLVTHDREGGVRQNVRDRALGFRTAGLQALILKPQRRDGRYRCAFDAATDGTYCNLSFDWATEQAALRAFLASADLLVVEIHHLLGHDFAVTALLRAICPVTDIYLHDYAWYCPRITLTNAANRYCGEPDLAGCETCIADFGARTGEAIGPTLLQQRSAALFAEARTLVAPSPGTARRFADRFGRAVVARRWENDTAIPPPPPPPPWSGDRPRRICVVGGIGPEKGYDLLLDCARFIRDRKLPLHLHVVGFTSNDRSLLNTGQVTITGRYDEDEVLELIRAQNADFGFLPSLWPETWSHVLTQMWLARLNVVAFDLGAPAERIRDRRGGRLIPPDAQLPQILQLFLSPAPFG